MRDLTRREHGERCGRAGAESGGDTAGGAGDAGGAAVSRRRFLAGSAAGLALAGGLATGCRQLPRRPDVFRGGAFPAPVAVATWKHGMVAVEKGYEILRGGGDPLDAVEKGINLVEVDPEVTSVGVGGLPNADGVVQLDAAIMDGDHLRCGAVFALEKIDRPISVARLVMERTRHIQLAHDGAYRFAIEQGFKPRELLTERARQAWMEWKSSAERRVPGQVDAPPPAGGAAGHGTADHDTIGMVALGADGRICSGCSTSGLAWKIPGRVGDSPIVGAGLYCDGAVGGASATGIGEEVIRVCGSFVVVEAMRRGASPQEAVLTALERIVEANPLNRKRQVAFVALSRDGRVGAASILPGFQVAIRSPGGGFLAEAWSLGA